MNALLLLPVYRSGGFRYASRTIFGIVTLAVFTDALVPLVPRLRRTTRYSSASGAAWYPAWGSV